MTAAIPLALGPLHGGPVVLLLGADGPRLKGGGSGEVEGGERPELTIIPDSYDIR